MHGSCHARVGSTFQWTEIDHWPVDIRELFAVISLSHHEICTSEEAYTLGWFLKWTHFKVKRYAILIVIFVPDFTVSSGKHLPLLLRTYNGYLKKIVTNYSVSKFLNNWRKVYCDKCWWDHHFCIFCESCKENFPNWLLLSIVDSKTVVLTIIDLFFLEWGGGRGVMRKVDPGRWNPSWKSRLGDAVSLSFENFLLM